MKRIRRLFSTHHGYPFALAVLRSRMGLPTPLVEATLLGRKLSVRFGSIRTEPDRDDAWLYACARNAQKVIDVGANIGQASLLLLQSPSIHSIILVDPNPDALAVAAENLIRNGMGDRAQFLSTFVGEQDDQSVTLWTVGTGSAGSRYSGAAEMAFANNASLQVRTLTLDTICARYEILPDLVKIDVEGAEHEVLLGSAHIASKCSTRFFVEMHSPPELPMAENARRVLTWCHQFGYSAWFLAGHVLLTSPEQIQHLGRCHLLLQPESWDYPMWLQGISEFERLEAIA